MKKLFIIFLLAYSKVFSQGTVPIRGELQLINGTKDVPQSYLFNKGNGITEFRNPDATPLGVIYNKNSWSDLSDFDQAGGITASVVSNKIQVSGGTPGVYTQLLKIKADTTGLLNWKFGIKVKIGTITANGPSYGIGINSINGFIPVSCVARVGFTSGNSGNSQVFLDRGQSGVFTNYAATSTTAAKKLKAVANDYVWLTVEQIGTNVVVISAYNMTTNSGEVDTLFNPAITGTSNGTVQLHNTGLFSVYSQGGSFTIDSISITSNEFKNASVLCLGDSKTMGVGPYYPDNAFVNILSRRYRTVVNEGNSADRTTEALARVTEIIALKPKQVLLNIGRNDLASGVSTGTWQANYAAIVTRLTAAGIQVIHLQPFWESTQDQSALYAFINSNYSNIIDTYAATIVPGSTATDAIHPSDSGGVRIANAIISSTKLLDQKRNSRYDNNSSSSGGGSANIHGTAGKVMYLAADGSGWTGTAPKQITFDSSGFTSSLDFPVNGQITLHGTAYNVGGGKFHVQLTATDSLIYPGLFFTDDLGKLWGSVYIQDNFDNAMVLRSVGAIDIMSGATGSNPIAKFWKNFSFTLGYNAINALDSTHMFTVEGTSKLTGQTDVVAQIDHVTLSANLGRNIRQIDFSHNPTGMPFREQTVETDNGDGTYDHIFFHGWNRNRSDNASYPGWGYSEEFHYAAGAPNDNYERHHHIWAFGGEVRDESMTYNYTGNQNTTNSLLYWSSSAYSYRNLWGHEIQGTTLGGLTEYPNNLRFFFQTPRGDKGFRLSIDSLSNTVAIDNNVGGSTVTGQILAHTNWARVSFNGGANFRITDVNSIYDLSSINEQAGTFNLYSQTGANALNLYASGTGLVYAMNLSGSGASFYTGVDDYIFLDPSATIQSLEIKSTGIKTADPSGGKGLWLLGKQKAAAVTLDTTHYVEVKIDGTLYKLAIVN